MTKKYRYTNDMGVPKTLVVTSKGDIYEVSIWNNLNGEYCGGSSQVTKEQLDEFLSHYHIK